jgi:hypothetical protein
MSDDFVKVVQRYTVTDYRTAQERQEDVAARMMLAVLNMVRPDNGPSASYGRRQAIVSFVNQAGYSLKDFVR